MLVRPWRFLLIGSILLSTCPASGREKRFFRSSLSREDGCGVHERCTFSLVCWLSGGAQARTCGTSGLFTCCVPRAAGVRSGSWWQRPALRKKYDHHRSRRPLPRKQYRPPPSIPEYRPTVAPPPPTAPPARPAPTAPPAPPAPQLWSPSWPPPTSGEDNNNTGDEHEEVCGVPRPTLQRRIVGGSEARFGELPWQVHIKISPYQCGGVLLNHYYVATAAHCIRKAHNEDIIIHIGDFDTKDTGSHFEPQPAETFHVVDRKVYPHFKFLTLNPDRFDLALLRLDRRVEYRTNILPICLPSPGEDFLGMTGLIAGWGKTTATYGRSGTNILHRAQIPIITNSECISWHRKKGILLRLEAEMFCAGYKDGQADACLGDSGGPLIVNVDGRWTLAGIISAGYGCAMERQPGIYHNVSVTADWIREEIREKKTKRQDEAIALPIRRPVRPPHQSYWQSGFRRIHN